MQAIWCEALPQSLIGKVPDEHEACLDWRTVESMNWVRLVRKRPDGAHKSVIALRGSWLQSTGSGSASRQEKEDGGPLNSMQSTRWRW